MKNKLPKGLYAITAENFSNGKDNITVVKEMLDGGAKIIQYREKFKNKLEKFKQCEIIRNLTLDYDCFFIVNDDIDIALSVNSDGVHIGQDDLPIKKVRKIVGSDMVIGLSTHSTIQAQKAVENGADYIGVGPIFHTFTKENGVQPVGLNYLDYCVKNIKIPKIVIGGIKFSNLEEILKHHPENICMVSEITSSNSISETVKKAREVIDES
ncbi:MAG: thiamine phosphate synthase [Elusimicrobiota bacterium]|jgi:thiamine-phosphate pyrophosphorylase|nr:thiamine phosphate synthase [Elusimicrobiota bacterium]